MKFGTVVKIVGALVVAVVVGAVIYLMSLDFNDYKPEIIAQVKQHTGRDLSIDGDLKLELSLTPAVAVSGVKFANAGWGSRPNMAVIDRFEAQVSLLPLISGNVEIQKIVLSGVDILIETDKNGRANYVFDTGAKKEEPAAKAEGGDLKLPVIRHVSIKDAKATYKDGVSGQQHVIAIKDLSVQGTGASDPMELALEASYNDNPFKLKTTVGAPAEFLAPSQPWPVTMLAEAGGAVVNVKGTVANPSQGKGLNLALSVKGSQLADLSALAGAPVPALGAYELTGSLTGDPASAINLANMKAKIGSSDIGGDVSVKLGGSKPAITAKLASNKIVVSDFQAPGAAAEKPAPAQSAQGQGGEKRVFPDDPLPLDGLKAVNADVALTIVKLVAAIEVDEVQVNVGLKDGDLNVSTLKGVVADGTLNGNVRLNASSAPPRLNSKLDIDKLDVGKALADLSVTDLLEGKVNVAIDLQGQGNSVRKLMAGLDGNTQIVMGAGRMKSTALDTFIGGPAKMLTELFVGKQSEYTVINCMVSFVDIKKGLATNKALLFDTDYATIVGKGTVNLATEGLDLTVDPRPKSATVNTAVPVVIQGTMAEPSYSVDKLAAARKVGGLLGAFAFPPAALIGLGELGTGDDNPCAKQAKGGEQQAQPKPAAESPLQNPAGAVGGAAEKLKEGVGGALKGLFGN